MNVIIEKTWKTVLKDEFEKTYFKELCCTVDIAYLSHTNIFPPQSLIFNAFTHCRFNEVRVVILGQDPYHGFGQAHGLSFSVPEGVKIPPSLHNIFKEINATINADIPQSGNLEHWANQGVFLLNSVLTVEENQARSHTGIGWERFTDAVIQKISNEGEHIVFLLWGTYAQTKGKKIDITKHIILTAPHPSPLSAYRGFLGCNHFNKANEYLKNNGKKPILW